MELDELGYLPTYDGCYVCGQEHPRGLRARFFVQQQGQVHVRFTPDATQTGYDDVVHGGVVAALMDELLGWVIVKHTERMCFTAEITVRFLKILTVGHVYVGNAGPCVDQGRYWESKGRLCNEEGEVHAKALGKYFLLSEEHTRKVVNRMTGQPEDLPVLRRMNPSGEEYDGR